MNNLKRLKAFKQSNEPKFFVAGRLSVSTNLFELGLGWNDYRRTSWRTTDETGIPDVLKQHGLTLLQSNRHCSIHNTYKYVIRGLPMDIDPNDSLVVLGCPTQDFSTDITLIWNGSYEEFIAKYL